MEATSKAFPCTLVAAFRAAGSSEPIVIKLPTAIRAKVANRPIVAHGRTTLSLESKANPSNALVTAVATPVDALSALYSWSQHMPQ
jgi:hypothetical protein